MDKQNLINQRNHYISNLQQFLSSSKETVQEILNNLDWSTEKTVYKEHEKNFTQCTLNSAHSVPVRKLEEHTKMCLWHKQGYDDDSVPLPQPSTSSNSSIVIDKELQANIILEAAAKNPNMKIGANIRERDVPQTADRFFSDFTGDERRALYNFAVEKTKGKLPELKEFSLPTEAESIKEPMTKEQMMAAERDAKRRRVRYRSSKVHTKSKNYSEVMREVINNQMQTYEDWLREQLGIVSNPEPEFIPKNKKEEEKKSEEMVWLDWRSFRDNPYLWWKRLIIREKRTVEQRERDKSEESGSRRRTGQRNYCSEDKDRRRKYDYDRNDRYKDSRTSKSEKDLYCSERERSDKNKDDFYRYKTSRHKERWHQDSEKESHKSKDKYVTSERSKRTRSHYDQANGRGKERYYNQEWQHDRRDKIDQDYTDPESDNEHHYSKKHKANEFVNVKQVSKKDRFESDTDSKSNPSSSSSESRTPRKKKSKKKHSHKHKSRKKKKHHSKKYDRLANSDESSTD